jgi:hypothetical protein
MCGHVYYLQARGDALLADFGLATTLATASIKYLSNAGTPRYMSPEQFQGVVSKESDQYALGCIAYELWTGHALFSGADPVSLMYKHVSEAPVPLSKFNPNIPPSVEQAILKALAKQRHDRHVDIKEFIAALRMPSLIQKDSNPSARLTIADLNSDPALNLSVTDLINQRKAAEDEEQSTFIKAAVRGEDRTHSHNTPQNTPFPTMPGYVPSKELPTLLPVTPLPELPTSWPHKRDKRWLIVALVSFITIASIISGSFIMFSSFHSPNGGKGNTLVTSAQLGVQPNNLDFGTLEAGAKVIQTVFLTNRGRQALDWEVDTGGTTWLQVRPHSGVIEPGGPQRIIYTTADTHNLTPGTYVASENIHSNTGNTQIPVKLIVITSSGKKQAKLSINPSILNFGSLIIGQQTTSLVTVGNSGALGLNWTADTGNASWLSINPASGTIQPGGIPQTMKVVANTAHLAAGNYSAKVDIQSNGGNSLVSVLLGVSVTPTRQPVTQPPGPTLVPPQIKVNPQNMSFNNVPINTTKSQQLTITNVGGQSLNWSANTDVNWISLDINSGRINQGKSQSFNLTVDTQSLSGGQTYSGSVSFASNGGSFNLSVSLSTVANPAVLSVDQSSINANNTCTWVPGSGRGVWTCNLTLNNAENASSSLNWTSRNS